MNDWRDEAACRGMPTSWWFPTVDERVQLAIAICAQCPVREECLEEALMWDRQFGIWGGTTARQREEILKYREMLGLPPPPLRYQTFSSLWTKKHTAAS